jgi:hypothetical protein
VIAMTTSTRYAAARGSIRLVFEAGYLMIIGVLAALGGIIQDGHYYLAAVLLTLPMGIVALVGVYLGYALCKGLGGLFLSITTADGSDAGWLTVSSGVVATILFVAAAAANVLLLRTIRRRRPNVNADRAL